MCILEILSFTEINEYGNHLTTQHNIPDTCMIYNYKKKKLMHRSFNLYFVGRDTEMLTTCTVGIC